MKQMKRIMALLLCVVMVLSNLPMTAHAAGVANVTCSASAKQVTAGEEFTVTVKNGAMTQETFACTLEFDNELLTCTGIETKNPDNPAWGALMASWGPVEADAFSTVEKANQNSQIGFTVLGTSEETYEAGTIYTATFKAKSAGVANFTLTEDSVGTNGYKGTAAEIFVEIKKDTSNIAYTVSDRKVSEGEQVTVAVTNADMSLMAFVCKLGFDETLLKCVSIENDHPNYPNTAGLKTQSSWAKAATFSTVAQANESGLVSFTLTGTERNFVAGTVFTVTFEALKTGKASFTLEEDSAGTDGFKGQLDPFSVEIVDKCPHTDKKFVYASNNDGTHTMQEVCAADCGKVFDEKVEDCSGGDPATCEAKSVCRYCEEPYGELGEHDYGERIQAQAPDHTADPITDEVAAHYQCSVCEKYFDAEKNETTLEELTTQHNKDGEGKESVSDADCENAGQIVDTTFCTVCDTVISRGEAKPDPEHPALGHDWTLVGDCAWSADNSACTAQIQCQRENCEEVKTVTGTVTSQTTPSTCSAEGETVYTATFAYEKWTGSDTKTVPIDIDSDAHAWNTEPASYENVDETYHTPVYTCQHNAAHTKQGDAVAHTYENGVCVCGETKNYTVTWKDEDGNVIESDDVEHGDDAGEAPAVPAKPGYSGSWAIDPPDDVIGDVTIHPEYTPNNYQIVWMVDDEVYKWTENEQSKTHTVVVYDTAIEIPDVDPVKEGHTFQGWYTGENGTGIKIEDDHTYNFDNGVSATALMAEDVTISGQTSLYAYFTANSYTVTFTINGEQYGEPIAFTYGAAVVAPEYIVPEGHDFSGWDLPAAMPAENITLDATLTVKTYTITLNDLSYGVEIVGDPVATHGQKLEVQLENALLDEGKTTNPEVFYYQVTIGGKLYNGIGDDEEEDLIVYNSETNTLTIDGSLIKGDVKIYACAQVYVQLDLGSDVELTLPDGITPPEGWTLDQWLLENMGPGYKEGKVTVSRHASDKIEPSDCDTWAMLFVKEGHSIDHLEFDDGSNKIFDEPHDLEGKDTYLKAVWKPNQYTVTLMDGDKTLLNIGDCYGDTLTLNYNATKEGHTFTGWNTEPDGSGDAYTDSLVIPAHDVTLYAQWEVNSYKVTFKYGYLNDKGEEPSIAMTRKYGSNMIPVNLSRPGYTFAGWMDENKEVVEVPATVPAKDVTYTAKWEAKTYDISYDLDDGALAEGQSNPAQYTIESDAITLVNPTKEGYTFAGWTGTGLDKATMTVTIPTGSTGNREYKATWTVNQYTVTWVGTDVVDTLDYGTELNFKGELPKKTGYVVKYWDYYHFVNGKYIWYGGETMPAYDIYAYPNWEKNTAKFTITFYDGETVIDAIEVQYDDFFTAPAPTKAGYTFVDWVDANGDPMPGKLLVEADQAYYAKWQCLHTVGICAECAVAEVNGKYYGSLQAAVNAATVNSKVTLLKDTSENVEVPKNRQCQIDLNGKTLSAASGVPLTVHAQVQIYATNGGEIIATNSSAIVAGQTDGSTTLAPVTLVDPITAEGVPLFTVEAKGAIGIARPGGRYSQDPTKCGAVLNSKAFLVVRLDDGYYTIEVCPHENKTFFSNDTHHAAVKCEDCQYTFIPYEFEPHDYTYDAEKHQCICGAVEKFTVIWTVDGEEFTKTNVAYGAAVVAPEYTVPVGYTLVGWDAPEKMPAENIILEATLTANTVNFYLHPNGGAWTNGWEEGDYRSSAFTYGNNDGVRTWMTLQSKYVAREGYSFKGWTTVKDDASTLVTIDQYVLKPVDVELYALWEINTYTISWKNIDGETLLWEPVEHGQTPQFNDYSKPAYPAEQMEEGYTYTWIGWSEENGGEMLDSIPAATQDEDYFAVYERTANYYRVNWYVDGEFYEQTIVQYGKMIEAPTEPTKEGYSFNGWEIKGTMPAKDITLDAGWTANTHEITWIVDDEKNITTEGTYGTEIALPDEPTKEGHTFVGWEDYTEGMTMPDEALTFTAQWKVKTYTVTWTVDDETYATTQATYGQEIPKPETDPQKTGYTFSGWNVPATMPDNDQLVIAAEFTVNTYTITWEGNGGSWYNGLLKQRESKLPYGSTLYACSDNPSRPGYKFIGWNTMPDGSGEWWEEGLTVPAYNASYFAQWEHNGYTITWNVDGVTTTTTVKPGQMPAFDGTPEKAADETFTYTFAGWDKVLVPVTEATTYTAVFTRTGWDGDKYLVEDKVQMTGWTEIDGEWYYLDPVTGIRAEGIARVPYPADAIDGNTYAPAAGTIDAEKGWFLFGEDGVFQSNTTGIDTYYGAARYAKNGHILWNPGLVEVDSAYYYFTGDETQGGNILATGDIDVAKNSTDRNVTIGGTYTFGEDGKLCEYDGITDMANGTKRYYKDAQLMKGAGLVKIDEEKYIFVRTSGELVVGKAYWVPENDLNVKSGIYSFDKDGFMINPIADVMDGFYYENGGWYCYRNGKRACNLGLISVTNAKWFRDGETVQTGTGLVYVRSNGQLAVGEYYITNVSGYTGTDYETGDKLPFNEFGLLANLKNGIYAENGSLYYYVDNSLAYNAGVIQLDGKYYYVKSTGEVVNGKSYWITNVGDSGVVVKQYTFAEDGTFEPVFTLKQGIIDGYYYVDDKIAYGAGVVEIEENVYIYVRSNGQLATGVYWPTNTNGYLNPGSYDWGTDGKLYL